MIAPLTGDFLLMQYLSIDALCHGQDKGSVDSVQIQ